ncbi:lectin like domain-containing protein [Acetobacterium sp.]|uniref:lectin like domain-containing protein n=1 Tax=Acetobacterium sp. TaxID=1872094 RepID=UPI0035935F53
MKNKMIKTALLLALGFVLILLFSGSISAQENDNIPVLREAIPNPEFVQYMVEHEQEKMYTLSEENHNQGYIPPPLKRYEGSEMTAMIQTMDLPATFDLRTTDRVTPIRNQSPYGTCWSFASMASLESHINNGDTIDLSENNLIWNHGFNWGPYDGGNEAMATAYFARWSGPVNESDDPYGSVQKIDLSPAYHVQDVENISKNPSEIKEALMAGGALMTGMYAGSFDSATYYNSDLATLFYDGNEGINHNVAIVGWDDNFDRNQFNKVPPGNGAWIIRNSWGTNWGDGGYFYMSYYDTYAGSEVTAFHSAESTSNYSRVYQYDPFGSTSAMGYDNNGNAAWGANIFRAVASENLTAISTYALSPGTTLEISIYTNVNTTEPTSGTLQSTKTVLMSRDGYHTIALDRPVQIEEGQLYSVVIKYLTPNNDRPIPIEKPITNYCTAANANPNESFISFNGVNYWYDISTERDSNLCIKAFTEGIQPARLENIVITNPASKLIYNTGEALDISGLQVSGTYSDGSTKVETITTENITGFSSESPASNQVLSVTVNGKTVTYTVQIIASVVLGDVDVNGLVQAYDALLALRIATGNKTGTPAEIQAADVGKSGTVEAFDALRILQYATGKIKEF